MGDPIRLVMKSWQNAVSVPTTPPPIIGPQIVDIIGFIIVPSAQCNSPLAHDHIIDRLPIEVPMSCVVAVAASTALQIMFISHTP